MSIIDTKDLENGLPIEADVCIVGGGAAGIALASELIDAPFTVALLESGGFQFRHGPQFLARGESVGLRSFPLAFSRFRQFGGSITRWAGKGRPFEPIDFEDRPWIPHSGWPFDRAHLEPYYRRAQAICRLGPYGYDGRERSAETRPFLPIDERGFETKIFEISSPRDFSRRYRPIFSGADNLQVYLHATATEIELESDSRLVRQLVVKGEGGKEFRATARLFILAGGGIENPRILLHSNGVQPRGVGNENDLVGRYFADHPMFYCGWFDPVDPIAFRSIHVESCGMSDEGDPRYGVFSLSEETLRREELNNCGVFLIDRPNYKTQPEYFRPGGRAFVHLLDILAHTDLPDRDSARDLLRLLAGSREVSVTLGRRLIELFRPNPRLALRAQLEATPHPESRVTLTRKRDRLGMRRVAVDWRLNRGDRRGLHRLLELMETGFERSAVGKLHLDVTETDGSWPDSMSGGKHHMGTTRMHSDPRHGVVDRDCRVHSLANLYIAGSSVFPTGGYANPTLTIVALAVKLADHIRSLLGSGAPDFAAGKR